MDVTYAYSPSTLEAKAGESEVQGCSWLYSEFEASLGYQDHERTKKDRIETLFIDNHIKL